MATSEDSAIPISKRVEQGRVTRGRLLEIATRLFAERGYEGASIEAVLAEAGISRGALYHHFRGKRALFEAVLEALQARVAEQLLEEARAASDPAEAFRAGCMAWLRLARDPDFQRIALVDAPSVLGWVKWREIDECHCFGLLKAGLRAVADTGRVRSDLVDTLAHVLNAALGEVALKVARAEDQDEAVRTGEAAIEQLLDALLAGPAA